MESLPALPLGLVRKRKPSPLSATGTDDSTPSPLVPALVPTSGKPCILGSILDKLTRLPAEETRSGAVAVSAFPVKRNNPLTTAVNGLLGVETNGFEPSTPGLQSARS